MDEIVIDDKRYISSKRAAHLTGYAKDYVGQLCREGRVPARLVGRAWYVLKTAIQDHRFGSSETPIENKPLEVITQPVLPERWDAARYSIPESSFLPELKKPQPEVSVDPTVPQETLPIEESWREFFTPVDEPVVVEEVVLNREVSSQRPVTDIRPNVTTDTVSTRGIAAVPRRKRQNRLAIRVFSLILMVSAALSASIAALNSGFFDTYLISASRASVITGFSVYEKDN